VNAFTRINQPLPLDNSHVK